MKIVAQTGWWFALAGLLMLLTGCGQESAPEPRVVHGHEIELDANLPVYEPKQGIEGTLLIAGSDTMEELNRAWARIFSRQHPDVRVVVEGNGSGTAAPALISGTAGLGAMSRAMRGDEIRGFAGAYGYAPTEIPVCIDAAAIFVHESNPISGLSLAQVDAIFSITRKRGSKPITTWGDLGLAGEWASKPVKLYGRNFASGTHDFFMNEVFLQGQFKPSVTELPSSQAVLQEIALDPMAIGYAGIAYMAEGVHTVPLSHWRDPDTFYEPTHENCVTGKYELAREMRFYVNLAPGSKLTGPRAEFLRFVFSKEGQRVAKQQGFFPLSAEQAAEKLNMLKIEGVRAGVK